MSRASANLAPAGGGIVLRVASLFGALMTLAIAALLGAWLYGLPPLGFSGARERHLGEARQALELSADSRVTQIEMALRERRGDIYLLARLLAEDPAISQELGDTRPLTRRGATIAETALQRHFASVMSAYPDSYENLLLVATKSRRVLAASDGQGVGEIFAETGLLERLATPGVVEHMETVDRAAGGEGRLIIARQILEYNREGIPAGKLLGVVVASIPIGQILGQFDRAELRSLGDSGSVSLFDRRRLLASFRLATPADGQSAEPPPPARGMEGSSVETAVDGRAFLATHRFVPIGAGEGWSLVVRREREEVLRDITRMASRLLVFGLLFTACCLIVVTFAARHLTRPIRKLASAAQRLADGDLSARVALARPGAGDEVSALASAFDTMAMRFEAWHSTLAQEVETRTLALNEQQAQLEVLVARRTADLTAALSAAEAADRAKDAFLANVSHELRTPLNAVIGLSGLARRLATNRRQRDYLDKIAGAGKTLAHLIDDLLDLSKIVAGHLEFEHTTFSLRVLVERCHSAIRHRAAEKGLEFAESIAAEVPDLLLGDPLRVEQILLNLLSNAVKFTAAGRIDVRIGVRQREEQRVCLEIAVEDSGVGIGAEEMALLFQPFAQADATMSRKFGGTGLGLAICRRLAKRMDGDVEVSSRPGSGSTFRVRIWLGIGDERAQATANTAAEDLPTLYRDAQVLVVEDQPVNREIVEALLAEVGITPQIAANGREALDRLRAAGPNAFDLVLMDLP